MQEKIIHYHCPAVGENNTLSLPDDRRNNTLSLPDGRKINCLRQGSIMPSGREKKRNLLPDGRGTLHHGNGLMGAEWVAAQ